MKFRITLLSLVLGLSIFTLNHTNAQGCAVFVTVGQGYIHSCKAPIEINPHGGGIGATYTLVGPNASRIFSPINNGHWHFSDATVDDSGEYTLTATGGHTGDKPNEISCGTVSIKFTLTITGCCISPTISGFTNLTAYTTEACSAAVIYPAPIVTGTSPTVTYSIPSGSLFPLGTTKVIATATNSCGSVSDTFTVTVIDNINPTINAPANITTNANNAGCTGKVDLGSPLTSDNCSIASVTNDAPTVFPLGTTTITWTVTDGSGNKATATQTVTIVNPVTVAVSYTEGAYGVLFGYAPMSQANLTAKGSGGTLSYSWAPSTNLSNANIANPVFTANAACSPTYQVTATNEYGCTATASQYICVKDVSDPQHPGKVLLCHNGNTISISPSAVPAHFAHLASHADTWGPCGAILTCAPSCSSTSQAATVTTSALISNTVTGNTDELGVTTYPNPFTNTIKLKVAGNAKGKTLVTVYDVNGHIREKLTTQSIASEIILGQKLLPGVYVVEVKQGDLVKKIKMVKL